MGQSAMSRDPEQPRLRRDKVSLGGCGLMGMYYVGVAQYFEEQERAELFKSNIKKSYGSSAGSIACVLATCDCGWAQGYKLIRRIWESANSNALLGRLGVLRPSFKLYKIIRDFLEEVLPRDAHRRCRDKVEISLTVLPEMRNWLVSDFNTRAELINAVIASCYIPLIFGGVQPPVFRGKTCCDGGFTSNIPFYKDPSVVTISPFAGGCDICPQGEIGPVFSARDQPWQMSWENTERLVNVIFPARWEDMEAIFNQGVHDAARFVEKEGYLSNGKEQTTVCQELVTIPQQLSSTSLSKELDEDMATSDYFSMSPSHSRQPSISAFLNEVPSEDTALPSLLSMLGSKTQAERVTKATSWTESVGVTWQRITHLMETSQSTSN